MSVRDAVPHILLLLLVSLLTACVRPTGCYQPPPIYSNPQLLTHGPGYAPAYPPHEDWNDLRENIQ